MIYPTKARGWYGHTPYRRARPLEVVHHSTYLPMNGVAPALGLKVVSAAASKKDLKKLEREFERARFEAAEKEVFSSARESASQDRYLAWISEQESALQQQEVFTTAAKVVPWVLGGIGGLIGLAFIFRKKRRR